jgi:hypothetical protein
VSVAVTNLDADEWEPDPELDGGTTLDLGPGDMASISAGSSGTWHVTTPFKELFVPSRSG